MMNCGKWSISLNRSKSMQTLEVVFIRSEWLGLVRGKQAAIELLCTLGINFVLFLFMVLRSLTEAI